MLTESDASTPLFLPRLRALIGLKVRFEGRRWTVVEVVDSPPSLVLELDAPASVIQTDMHGRPWEFTAETRMIPALTPDLTDLSAELLDLQPIKP